MNTLENNKAGRPKKILTPEQLEQRNIKMKEQRAKYALNYYRKRIANDPEYAKFLNEKAKRNTSIRKGTCDIPRPVGRPRKDI